MTTAIDFASRHDLLERIDKNPVGVYEAYRGASEAASLATLPPHMRPGIVRYVLLGILPGSFLRAIFAQEDELAERRADAINRPHLQAFKDFVDNSSPALCNGNPYLIQKWCEAGGLLGRMQAEEVPK